VAVEVAVEFIVTTRMIIVAQMEQVEVVVVMEKIFLVLLLVQITP
jgi:hypothetical protein